jgi:hypothetical protein
VEDVAYTATARGGARKKESCAEDIRASHAGEEPFLYRRANDCLVRFSPANSVEKERAKLFDEFIENKLSLRLYKKK